MTSIVAPILRQVKPLGITADPKTGDLYVSVPDAVLKISFE